MTERVEARWNERIKYERKLWQDRVCCEGFQNEETVISDDGRMGENFTDVYERATV